MIRLMISYFAWHYTLGIRDYFSNAKNFIWFCFHLFSVGTLLKTLFSPWQKLSESYKRGFDVGALFETFVVNVITRIVGFLIRGVMIIIGTFLGSVATLIAILGFFVWILLPFIIVILFVSGIRLLI